jgi:class 3 adenylate cyclase/tetratricopeptide (TPR) repeat protein
MSGRAERKVVTVLFADLVGFTARSEALDPEDVAGLLAPYQSRLRTELERFGGTVEKFIGDAVMGLFGAPIAHEDDPERAVRAALAIRAFAEQEGIELRIGINTGEALVQLGADPGTGETMATGDVVNTAARLQSAAPVGGILVGARTYEATRHSIVYDAAEPVEAKGKAQPVPVWLARSALSRAAVELVRGAPLVGRRRELDLLVGALSRVREERAPQLVTLVGVPGIGKSRLVLELYDAIEAQPELVAWRQGRCLPYGDGVAFWALGEMVKAQLGILEDDSAEEALRKLQEGVADGWVASHLRPLVGLGSDADAGGDRRGEAFAAWRHFFEELAAERPLVLVFDDLHWADESLLDFVDHLVEWATAIPLLVVASARPELLTKRPGWGGGKPNATTISLAPLSDEETARLVGELLEQSVLPVETQVALLARAGGNPLYAEQYVHMLREHGSLDELPLPETVQGIIAARLDLLDPQQKALLHDAAVVGKAFWLGALAAIGGAERRELEQRLHELERRELVRRERTAAVAGEVEYVFRHVLVRDVSYGQIPRAARAEKHVHAARWIESLGRPDDHAEMLAHHYLQALELAEAAGIDVGEFAGAACAALVRAGDRAFALNAYDVAERHYRGGLALPVDDERLRGRLLLGLGRVLLKSAPDPTVLEHASAELQRTGDPEAAAEAETGLAELYWSRGERDACFEHLDRAHGLVEHRPASRAKAVALAGLSRFLMLAAEDEEAIRFGSEALAMAEELGLDEVRAAALNNIGCSRASLGDRRGATDIERAIEIARAANAPFEFCRATGNLAANAWMWGDVPRAGRLWAEAGEAAQTFGQHHFARWFFAIQTTPEAMLGEWDAALRRADVFLAEVEGGLPHYLASQCYEERARMRIARDDVERAVVDAEHGLELARRAKDPQALYLCLAGTARVLWEAGEHERATAVADEYLAALRGTRPLAHAIVATHRLSWVVTAAGGGPELAGLLEGSDVPWARAAVAFASGDPVRAADVCAEMSALAEEAFDRLVAARLLVEQGRRLEADTQLRAALAFYRRVGATRYVREGEALLAASA